MDGHPGAARRRTEPRLQADSPSFGLLTCAFGFGSVGQDTHRTEENQPAASIPAGASTRSHRGRNVAVIAEPVERASVCLRLGPDTADLLADAYCNELSEALHQRACRSSAIAPTISPCTT